MTVPFAARFCRKNATLRWLMTGTLAAMLLTACGKTDEPVAIVPIQDSQTPIFMSVEAGARTYRMVFDTGASYTVIDSRTATRDLRPMSDAALSAWTRFGEPVGKSVSLLEGSATLRYYESPALRYGQWAVASRGIAPAIDLPLLTQWSMDLGARVDGAVGAATLSTLNWVLNRRDRRLEGYRFSSKMFRAESTGMTCVPMLTLPEGTPAISIEIDGHPAVMTIDTGYIGNTSGGLSVGDIATLRYLSALAGEMTIDKPGADRDAKGKPVVVVKTKSVSLASLSMDGLVFQQTGVASARLGLGFLYKFEKIALDFDRHRFCFSALAQTAPDALPTP